MLSASSSAPGSSHDSTTVDIVGVMTREMSLLTEIVDVRVLHRMAGARAFERGESYFKRGHVGTLVEHDGTVSAKVEGTRTYRVKLWREDDALDYACSCPVGRDGQFCKHAVALGLALLQAVSPKAVTKAKAPSRVTLDDVRVHLLARDKSALVDMLMQQLVEDDTLRRRLLMEAASRGPGKPDLATCRQAIDDAVDVDAFVDYRDAFEYARGIDAAIDGIEKLLKQGHATEAIELAEHALAAVEQAMGSVDDSDGEMGALLERLQELHHRACKKAKPDPDALARRLFAWELGGEWDVFHGAARTYADVFGKKGLAAYRQLAEAEWANVPVLRPGRDDHGKYEGRFRITSIMEALAQQAGDDDALIAVKQRDLSSPYAFLQIAEIHHASRRHDLALDWAERGIKAFPQRTDARLRNFLADAYHRRKRHDDAMALIWVGFDESPGLETYKHLLAHARRSGQHASWRERALEHLRRAIASEQQRPVAGWARRRVDHSVLVTVFLWENDVEAAWCEARVGGCSEALWLQLAAKREKSHPQDALPIYQRQIEPTLAQAGNEAYRQAIGHLRKVRELMGRLEDRAGFTACLGEIRAKHKRKRNFITLLDRARW